MQSFTPSTPVEEKNVEVKMKSPPCHASTAPAKTKLSESSHGVKKSTYLFLKENGNAKPKQVIKIIIKPQVPACIKAGDVGSLLDQFLEYEENQSRCVTLVKGSSVSLTPISSPSHINKPNFTGIGRDAKPAISPPNELTPPVSPPLQTLLENTPTSCKTTLVTKTTATSVITPTTLSANTLTPPKKIPKIILSDVKNIKKDALKSNEATNVKINKIDDTRNNVVSVIKETKVELKKLAETKEVVQKPEVRLPSEMQRSSHASSSSPPTPRADNIDKIRERKRECTLDDDDDDEDDKNDYYDFKRKKYTRDECYWTTSEDESDDNRGRHKHRVGRKKESTRNSKRRHSRDLSSDSNNDNSRHKRNHSHGKYQRRHERSPRRRRSLGREISNDSDDDGHHRHRRDQRKHRRQERKSPEKDESKEDVHLYDIENERKKNFKLDRSIKENSSEKRKIVYIGNIESSMSKSDIWTIFRKFGPIEKTTVHYRDDGDNYSFVTFVDPSSALEAIEEGKTDPKLNHLDICFGGRRKFCGGSYVDFDSTTSYLEEQQEKEGSRKSSNSNEEMDFDKLLQMCLKKSKR